MKKIFLTGVVLVLLIILATDFFMERRIINHQDRSVAAATQPANPATTTNDVAVTTHEGDMNNTAPGYLADATARPQYSHRHGRAVVTLPVDEQLPVAANTPENGIQTWDEENPAPAVTVERSQDFLGNVPDVVVEDKRDMQKEIVTPGRHNVHFGVETGLMQNTFYNNSPSDMLHLGFFAGGIADIGLGDHFALQPGIRYVMKGVNREETTSTALMETDTRDKISLHYIEVPLDVVVRFGNRDDGRFMIGAGPYISYLAKAQDKYRMTTTALGNNAARTTQNMGEGDYISHPTIEGQNSIPIGNDNAAAAGNMRTLDWGVNGFIGCQMPGGIYAKAGTEAGLRDVRQSADGSYSGRNLNFFVSVGYLIGYGK